MKHVKLSSNKDLQVISETGTNPQSPVVVGNIRLRIHDLYSKLYSLIRKPAPESKSSEIVRIQYTPLEELMNKVSRGINTLPDESIIALARGLHGMFGNGAKRDRKVKLEYINAIIMPLTGEENTELPTVLISEINSVIMNFRDLVKEKVQPIMKQKVARLK